MPVARRSRPSPSEFPGAAQFLPARHTLPALREAVQGCRGCPLYRHATQAVFGEGAPHARVMLVGEQPGDVEDRAGRPFVGPAGRVLDAALAAAGIPRDDVYVTNVVKHFKYSRRGKRRIHDKPTRYEQAACEPWLGEELAVVRPAIVVLLGATAAQALLGARFRVTQARGRDLAGEIERRLARHTFATVHPSSARARSRGPRARARGVLRRPRGGRRVLSRAALSASLRARLRTGEADVLVGRADRQRR